ncbi:hypothetical protein EGW08_021853, partial [Elysia chlorotica]
MASETAHKCLYITQEQSELPVWHQIQNNGSLGPDELEIRYASTVDDMNNLSLEDFSDEENELQDEGASNFRLRKYQSELADIALTGRNCIICAPTGSGKTKVAIEIIQEHLKRVPNAKVAFFANTVHLVLQQHKAIERHLPSYKVLSLTGKSKDSLQLHMLLHGYHVVVLSPTILVNHLCGKRPSLAEGISAFTLLVFDECHHTQKDESYNEVMYYYLKEKRKGLSRKSLPQIVGLTASIGIDKATNIEDATRNIMKICGNLDVDHLAVVKRNIDELREIVPMPEEYQEELVENTSIEVRTKIYDIMERLEAIAEHYAKELNDGNVSNCMRRAPSSKKCVEYCQWVCSLRKAVTELEIDDGTPRTLAFRYLDIITDYLQAYHLSLETLDLAQVEDVMNHLDQSFTSFGPEMNPERSEQEERFYEFFLDLKETATGQRIFINPNLEKLAARLRENVINRTDDARAIVFVRTRVLSEAVASWLNRCGEVDLMGLNAKKFTGSTASEDQGGMSVAEQNFVMDNFRSGKVRVLIATSIAEEGVDIPECNVVIRYNYARNEISKVQTRGRSRTFGGVSVLLAMPAVVQRERMNCERERLMQKALFQISEKSSAQFSTEIDAYQKKLFAEWDVKAMTEEERKRKFKDVQFRVLCRGCKKISVHSSEMRTINATHRISISRKLLDHIRIEPTKAKSYDGVTFGGTAYCRGETKPGKRCGYRIGKFLSHKGCPFITLGCDKLIFVRDHAQHPDPQIKQWKDVEYYMEELSIEQLHKYAT